jgi:hypothetical protein
MLRLMLKLVQCAEKYSEQKENWRKISMRKCVRILCSTLKHAEAQGSNFLKDLSNFFVHTKVCCVFRGGWGWVREGGWGVKASLWTACCCQKVQLSNLTENVNYHFQS